MTALLTCFTGLTSAHTMLNLRLDIHSLKHIHCFLVVQVSLDSAAALEKEMCKVLL